MPQFSMKISMGHVLQIIAMATAIFVWSARQDSRIAVNEFAIDHWGEQVQIVQQDLKQVLTVQQAVLARLEQVLQSKP